MKKLKKKKKIRKKNIKKYKKNQKFIKKYKKNPKNSIFLYIFENYLEIILLSRDIISG